MPFLIRTFASTWKENLESPHDYWIKLFSHLPTNSLPSIIEIKTVVDGAGSLQWSQLHGSCPDQRVGPQEAALGPDLHLDGAPLDDPLEGLVPRVDDQRVAGVVLGVVGVLHHRRLVHRGSVPGEGELPADVGVHLGVRVKYIHMKYEVFQSHHGEGPY